MGLQNYIRDWAPTALAAHDDLLVSRADELAATLDLDETFVAGDVLPLLWQWVYFLDWPKTDQLGPDGHPRDGHFLPPIPHRRRMFAGGRLSVESALLLGQPAVRHSELACTTIKQGRTGELLFVTVRHEYRQDGVVRMIEEQDLVYRSDDLPATMPSAARRRSGSETLPATMPSAARRRSGSETLPADPWACQPVTHPALLFRFSALTANAHRIHYDQAYTTGTEGFPTLVVHGPLLAVYLAELVRSQSVGRLLSGFEFRLRRPVFVGDEIRVQGAPSDDGATADLAVVSGANTVHATARAEYR